jgi:hypothetical protein
MLDQYNANDATLDPVAAATAHAHGGVAELGGGVPLGRSGNHRSLSTGPRRGGGGGGSASRSGPLAGRPFGQMPSAQRKVRHPAPTGWASVRSDAVCTAQGASPCSHWLGVRSVRCRLHSARCVTLLPLAGRPFGQMPSAQRKVRHPAPTGWASVRSHASIFAPSSPRLFDCGDVGEAEREVTSRCV